MTALKFTVVRERDDGGPKEVECLVPMEKSQADLIAYNYDWNDPDGESKCERAYNRFCDNRVGSIVHEQTGWECGYNWHFGMSPKVVEV